MDIVDYPFVAVPPAPSRPMLFVRFTSPSGFQDVPALIDTGATQCCLPAGYAGTLGLKLTSGTKKTMGTAGGKVDGCCHNCGMRVWNSREFLNGNKVEAHVVPPMPVYFIPGLQEPLLGGTFLDQYVLTVDYRREFFSIRRQFNSGLFACIARCAHRLWRFVTRR